MHLVIGRDGNITIQEHGEPDRAVDPADRLAILECYRATVEFEEGLTAAQLMRALRPWSDVLSRSAWIDFDAWIATMDRPLLTLVQGGGEGERLVGLELGATLTIHRSKREGGVELSLHEGWHPSGLRIDADGNPIEPCSITLEDPRSYGHLPITLDGTVVVTDVKTMRPWGEEAILPDELPGAYERIVRRPTFFDAVVLGFLDNISAHGTPDEVADVKEGIIEAVRAIQEDYADLGHGSDEVRGNATGVDDFFTRLGITVPEGADERADLVREIAAAHEVSGWPRTVAATVLGLSESGFMRLLAGQTSNYTLPALKAFVGRLRPLGAIREFVAKAADLYGVGFAGAALIGPYATGIAGPGDTPMVAIILNGDVNHEAELKVLSGLSYDLGLERDDFTYFNVIVESDGAASARGRNLARDIADGGIRLGTDGTPQPEEGRLPS